MKEQAMNGEGWAFACWLILTEGGYVSGVHGWQCVWCRHNWETRFGRSYMRTIDGRVNLKLFCKHSVCAECRVLFEPPAHGSIDRMWPNLCETHRKPQRDAWEKRKRVHDWVDMHFAKVEKLMLDDYAEMHAKQQPAMQGLYQNLAQYQQRL